MEGFGLGNEQLCKSVLARPRAKLTQTAWTVVQEPLLKTVARNAGVKKDRQNRDEA